MAKSIRNMRTLSALIKDEAMASKEYRALAMAKDTPPQMKKVLLEMSKDEHHHRDNLIRFREWEKIQRLK